MTIFAGGSSRLSGITEASRHLSVAFCAIAFIAHNTMAATDSRDVPFDLVYFVMFFPSCGNHPERSNIELPVQKCRGVRNETAEDRILPMSVQMFLRFVALVEELQGGICCGAVQFIDHYSGVRTGR
jgi:hypothetical protein